MTQLGQAPVLAPLLKQAWASLKNKQINDAIRFSQQLNKLHPNSANGWYFTSQVAKAIGNFNVAIQSLKNACKLSPNQNSWKISLVNLYLNKNEISQAEDMLEDLLDHELSAIDFNQIAMLFSQLNQPNKSIEYYQKAIVLEPENNEHYYSLAAVQRHIGELQQAEINLTKAIELQPLDIDAHALRVDLRKQSKERNYIKSLEQLLIQPLSAEKQVQVKFSLAKSFEDLAEYGTAFEHLQQGSALRRKHLNYDVKQDTEILTLIIQHFNQIWWQQPADNQSVQQDESNITPIFILGMPRTGSTLTDSIVSAGSNVHSAGELNDFSRLLTEQVKAVFGNKIKTKQQLIEASTQIDLSVLGKNYIAAVQAKFKGINLGSDVNYFTDKLPFNFLYAGLIQKALPNAKIIHVTRNSMDTCYAVFKTLFKQAYPFSYNQQELAQYFIAYQKLMNHWQTLPGLNIHTVSYENLIENTEQVAEDMYNFCGLAWQTQYADVESHTGIVTTASAAQVRTGIYQTSKNKWRHFEKQLQPIKSILEEAGINCD